MKLAICVRSKDVGFSGYHADFRNKKITKGKTTRDGYIFENFSLSDDTRDILGIPMFITFYLQNFLPLYGEESMKIYLFDLLLEGMVNLNQNLMTEKNSLS
mmetsp:Transcript_15941/g.22709  ORF Transcript_15941/g.22709 Transcript_15941/m.22709 type:complete len:101 (+) Transcript_15941:420-722(+)